MNCPSCCAPVPDCCRHCPACQADVGFPNVRAAGAPEELEALEARVENAWVSGRARRCEGVLRDFHSAVLESKAVICRSLSIVQYVLSSDTALYGTYYQQVHAGVRLPEDNSWDRGRASVDNTLFPNFADQIVFAALSLDGRGLTSFGSYAIVLKEAMIHHRASVFEENPFRFVRRHRVVVGDPIPTGYRAAWGRRGELALAKLHSRLGPATTPDDFAGMLMAEGTCSSDEDFIEVHIFGPIHRRAVERVIGPPPRHGERALMKSIERKLAEVGAILETR